MLSQVRKSGTTSDKIAAMSLMITSSATANIKSLDGLLALMAKTAGGKHVVVAAMEALQELFLTALLPDRKLKVLEQQPLQVRPILCVFVISAAYSSCSCKLPLHSWLKILLGLATQAMVVKLF